MAEWNKNKVDPSAINGGQEFINGDNLARDELNAIVNNSFYASEKAQRAEQLAESAVRGNGTLVTIGGQVQGEWSADFAESERQKSKNLFNINSNYRSSGTLSVNISENTLRLSTSNAFGFIGYKVSVKANATYTLSRLLNVITSGGENTGRIGIYKTSGNVFLDTISSENYKTFTTGNETEITIYFYAVPYGTTATAEVEFINIQLEEGLVATDYQPYDGGRFVQEGDIAGLKGQLLWENDDPTVQFVAQDVTLSSSDYDYLGIYYYASTFNKRCVYCEYIKGTAGFALIFSNTSANGAVTYIRNANVNNDINVVFEGAYQATGASAEYLNNVCCVPVKIIGYKRS